MAPIDLKAWGIPLPPSKRAQPGGRWTPGTRTFLGNWEDTQGVQPPVLRKLPYAPGVGIVGNPYSYNPPPPVGMPGNLYSYNPPPPVGMPVYYPPTKPVVIPTVGLRSRPPVDIPIQGMNPWETQGMQARGPLKSPGELEALANFLRGLPAEQWSEYAARLQVSDWLKVLYMLMPR